MKTIGLRTLYSLLLSSLVLSLCCPTTLWAQCSSMSGNCPTAVLSLTNSHPGIPNPSLANPPPAALRGTASGTAFTNAGLLGISHADSGLGVLGVATGTSPNANTAQATGVMGIATGTSSGTKPTAGVYGSTLATSGRSRGVEGECHSPEGACLRLTSINHAAMIVGANDFGGHNFSVSDDAVIHGRGLNTDLDVDVGRDLHVSGSLFVSGAKHAVAKLPNGRKVVLYAMESPENWFEDFGATQLSNGTVWVPLDQIFAQTANAEAHYHVFLTPTGNCRGLYVAKKTSAGFEVRELSKGRSNTTFDYRIVAQRRGFEQKRFEEAPPMGTALTNRDGN